MTIYTILQRICKKDLHSYPLCYCRKF